MEARVGIDVRALWWRDGDALVHARRARAGSSIPRSSTWLVQNGEPLAAVDLATMRLGPMRAEARRLSRRARRDLLVPLIDRGELVGLVEASYDKALREAERGLVAESARAAARALTFVGLARAAGARARDRARGRSRRGDAAAGIGEPRRRARALGRRRRVPHRTAHDRCRLVRDRCSPDGRLALLVTEAQAHGVAGGARDRRADRRVRGGDRPAPRASRSTICCARMRASSEGVLRGGEPVAAFLAILDAQAQTIDVGVRRSSRRVRDRPDGGDRRAVPAGSLNGRGRSRHALGGGGARARREPARGATRGETVLPDTLLVVASTALRGERRRSAGSSGCSRSRRRAAASHRCSSRRALKRGAPAEDLLAVVVRQRSTARSEPASIG